MNLINIAMIAAPSARSKSYLQLLCKNNLLIEKLYIMSNNPEKLQQEAEHYQPKEMSIYNAFFCLEEPLLYTARQYQLEVEFVCEEDINGPQMAQAIKNCSAQYIIYSGFGGQILKEPLFELGKRFIHVHAGVLPQYRGSTTVYYSLLKENCCGASAIFLEPGLDEGQIIFSQTYPMPHKGVDIDYVYEPFTRADVLVQALKQYANQRAFLSTPQSTQNADTFFIIHPVLKHIVLIEQSLEEGEETT